MDNLEQSSSKGVLTTPLGRQPLVSRIKTFDALGQPFRYELDLDTRKISNEIEPGALLGKTVTLSIRSEKQTIRHFHGYVAEFSKRVNHPTENWQRPVYKIVLRPWLWLLGLSKKCRVFHKSTAIEIVKKICDEHGFGDQLDSTTLKGTFRTYEYCVQYNESDFDFVSRLLEYEGIYYYFQHDETKHTVVLANDLGTHGIQAANGDISERSNECLDKKHIGTWWTSNLVRPHSYSLDDYDFQVPTKNLKVSCKTAEPYAYEEGTQFEYPGIYTEVGHGEKYVQYRVEAQNAPSAYVTGTTKMVGLTSGSAFTSQWSPDDEYVIIRAESTIKFAGFEKQDALPNEQPRDTTDVDVDCTFTAVLKNRPFRPERRTAKPVIAGVQTARVVAVDAGAKEGLIATDEHGRVMVKFFWADAADDAQRSCWMRVAQPWAGNAWGMQFVPRVGNEVIVAFLDGDPDRPIVVGSVYNGHSLAPFKLPNAEISGLKTDRGTQGGTSAEEPSVLQFDDGAGKIRMSSQAIGVVAKDGIGIDGSSVSISGGLAQVEVSGMTESISLLCPMTLTIQTRTAKIELGPEGVAITGVLKVNNAVYPVPPTPAQLLASATELAADAAKQAASDLAKGAVKA